MILQPGKFYKPDLSILTKKGIKNGGRMAVILYFQIKENSEVPLHHYYLYADTDKPPIFFIGPDQLTTSHIGGLGMRYYHNHPNPSEHQLTGAGRFLHEDRIVWVVEDSLKNLKLTFE